MIQFEATEFYFKMPVSKLNLCSVVQIIIQYVKRCDVSLTTNLLQREIDHRFRS